MNGLQKSLAVDKMVFTKKQLVTCYVLFGVAFTSILYGVISHGMWLDNNSELLALELWGNLVVIPPISFACIIIGIMQVFVLYLWMFAKTYEYIWNNRKNKKEDYNGKP